MSEPDEKKSIFTLVLGPELTIAQAATTQGLLLEALEQLAHLKGGALRLDLRSVSDFDSTGVQLLQASRRTLLDLGTELLLQPSAVVLAALECYGLDAALRPKRRSPPNSGSIEAIGDIACQ